MALSASSRDFGLEDTLHTKMAPMSPAFFDDKGNRRSNTKSKLREALAVTVSPRQAEKCETCVYDVSALLWSVSWPKEGSPLQNMWKLFKSSSFLSWQHAMQFLYMTDCTRKALGTICTWPLRHMRDLKGKYVKVWVEYMYSVLTPNTLSLPRDCILTVTENKMQMNTMLYKSQLVPEFTDWSLKWRLWEQTYSIWSRRSSYWDIQRDSDQETRRNL